MTTQTIAALNNDIESASNVSRSFPNLGIDFASVPATLAIVKTTAKLSLRPKLRTSGFFRKNSIISGELSKTAAISNSTIATRGITRTHFHRRMALSNTKKTTTLRARPASKYFETVRGFARMAKCETPRAHHINNKIGKIQICQFARILILDVSVFHSGDSAIKK